MSEDRNIYGEVDNKTDLKDIFLQIRKDVDSAKTRADLTELYRRAGYLITLSYASSWKEKFGDDISEIRHTAEHEFGITARKINSRAEDIGTDADYDEAWGEMKKARHAGQSELSFDKIEMQGRRQRDIFKYDLEHPTRANITVGGVPVKGQWRVNESLTMDGIIGTRFMIDWELTLDLTRGRAWVNPAK